MRIVEKVGRHVVRVIRDDRYDELKAENKFLVDRLDCRWNHFADDVGLSSNAMVRQAILGLDKPECFPRDHSDLGRCEATYRKAPPHLQRKMLPTLELFRAEAKVWPRGR